MLVMRLLPSTLSGSVLGVQGSFIFACSSVCACIQHAHADLVWVGTHVGVAHYVRPGNHAGVLRSAAGGRARLGGACAAHHACHAGTFAATQQRTSTCMPTGSQSDTF